MYSRTPMKIVSVYREFEKTKSKHNKVTFPSGWSLLVQFVLLLCFSDGIRQIAERFNVFVRVCDLQEKSAGVFAGSFVWLWGSLIGSVEKVL